MTDELTPRQRDLLIEAVSAKLTHLDQSPGFDPRFSQGERIENFALKQRFETLHNLLLEHPSIILHKP